MASVASACGIRPGYCECYLPSLDLPTCAVDTWEYRHTPRATETSLTPAGGELRGVPPVLSCGTLFAPLGSCPSRGPHHPGTCPASLAVTLVPGPLSQQFCADPAGTAN